MKSSGNIEKTNNHETQERSEEELLWQSELKGMSQYILVVVLIVETVLLPANDLIILNDVGLHRSVVVGTTSVDI